MNVQHRETSAFFDYLPRGLSITGSRVESILLKEYGGIFATAATPPDRVIFADEKDVARFQDLVESTTARIGEFTMMLQAAAMEALLDAISCASKQNIIISPRAADSAARSYLDTVELWRSRVDPALDHWTAVGRLDIEEASRIRELSPFEQVSEVFRHEADGLYFAKDLSKSVIYSVAPPGSSQHLSMLAFDVKEFADPSVRRILEEHGWFQTVVSDLPHFTYLGRKRSELSAFGLKLIEYGQQEFWIPDMP
jgi:hypothetical protein